MKKKQKTFAILTGVIVILLLAFFGMKYVNHANEEKEEQKKEEEKIQVLKADSLNAMTYADAEGNSMAFEKEEGGWKFSEDPVIELQEDVMLDMENGFSDIQAIKEISSPDELSDYGFDAVTYRLSVTEEDGTEHEYLFGNTTGEQIYFMEENGENVYTVSSELTSQMLWNLADIAAKDSFIQIIADHFVKEVITAPDGTQTVYEAVKETEDSEDETEQSDDAEENNPVEKVANGIAGMYFTDCVDYHVTDETKAGYGLDEASRTKVEVIYKDSQDGEKEKTVTFYVGKEDEDGTYYYVQLDGSIRVNRVLADSIEAILPE